MLKQTIALAALLSLAGCAGKAEFGADSNRQMTPTQLAAFAASTEYPREWTARNDMKVAAIVDRDDQSIKLYNFTDQPIRDAKLWVNQSFVGRIDGIAPMSKAVVRGERFYDKMGNSYADQKVEVTRVELQTPDALYNLQGPITEAD